MKWLALRVGGQRIPVYVVPPKHPKLESCKGIYHPDDGAIFLSNALAPDVRQDTLFHELDHAVNEVAGVNNLIAELVPEKERDALEERIVRARTPVWHALLKDLGFRFPKGPNE
jgi:Zn-dependent peptidase ImmA (M78 family)